MAIDKAVDSAQLDADLTTVADAIRTRAGTSGSLSFPAGMAAAILAIRDDPVIAALNVTENGVYTPEAGTDGFGPVTVNVSVPSNYGLITYNGFELTVS